MLEKDEEKRANWLEIFENPLLQSLETISEKSLSIGLGELELKEEYIKNNLVISYLNQSITTDVLIFLFQKILFAN